MEETYVNSQELDLTSRIICWPNNYDQTIENLFMTVKCDVI